MPDLSKITLWFILAEYPGLKFWKLMNHWSRINIRALILAGLQSFGVSFKTYFGFSVSRRMLEGM